MQREKEQQQRAQRKGGVATLQNALPGDAVGNVARNQKQKDAGQELRQPNESKIERPVRNLVHLPCDRDRLHLGRNRHKKSRAHVPTEIRVMKGGARLRLG
jgi:hypothetical protein